VSKGAGRSDAVVVLIGVFKLVKVAALVTIGVVALTTVPERVAAVVDHAVTLAGGLPGRGALYRLVVELWSIDVPTAHRFAVACLIYAAVFLVEGVGLVLRKHWAEWLTVVVTASFIPFEMYEMATHFGAGKMVALIANVAIVIYLLRLRLRDRGRRLPHPIAALVR
jgi:uncharacterized membrane protein (DUF2068 family)